MGRSHPVGIVLAAILFGVLYQGGAELAFEMPDITRDMIVIIQGLVILFAGALEHMFRPPIQTFFASSARRASAAGGEERRAPDGFFDTLVQVLACDHPRVACRCCLPALPASIRNAPACSTSVWKARCWPALLPARRPRRCPVRPGSGCSSAILVASAWRWCTASRRSPIAATRSSPASQSIRRGRLDHHSRPGLVQARRAHAVADGAARFESDRLAVRRCGARRSDPRPDLFRV